MTTGHEKVQAFGLLRVQRVEEGTWLLQPLSYMPYVLYFGGDVERRCGLG